MTIDRTEVTRSTAPAGEVGRAAASTTTVTMTTPGASRGRVLWILSTVTGSFVVITLIGVGILELWGGAGSFTLVFFLFSLVVPSLIAFFGTYLFRNDMREAITASFIVAYLLLLLSSAALVFGDTEAGGVGTLRNLLIQNFTGLMTVVVAFYFGSEAAIQVAKHVFAARVETPPTPNPGTGTTTAVTTPNAPATTTPATSPHTE